MKTSITFVSAFLIGLFLFAGCAKDDDNTLVEEPVETETPCIFEIGIEPICSFNPTVATTVPFPVRVLREGVAVVHPDYTFEWSSDEDFSGSAISISYENLPLQVTVTEVETGCTGTAVLENTYWD